MPNVVFGAGAIQTAYVSYTSIDLTQGSVVLQWPDAYVNVPPGNVLAASIDVNTANGNTNTITLPDATMQSVGANFIITNNGASSFNLLNNSGGLVVTIPIAGISSVNSYWIQLTANLSVDGTWKAIQFGAGSSSTSASDLKGFGLIAIGNTLNTNVPTQTQSTTYNIVPADRAKLFIWTGGTQNIILPNIATVSAGFYVSFNNQGTGTLTVKGDAKIDNNLAITGLAVQLQQSLTIISDGTQWWSLGLGLNPLSNLFGNGSKDEPSISFLSDTKSGFYYASPIGGSYVGASINQVQIASVDAVGLNTFDSTGNKKGTFFTGGSSTLLKYADGTNTGTIELSASVLQTTLKLDGAPGLTLSCDPQTTLNNIIAGAPANGSLLYYNGSSSNWSILAPGTGTLHSDESGNLSWL